MPPIAPGHALPDLLILRPESSPVLTASAGSQPGSESSTDAPPPGEARMEALFESIGIGLMLVIAVAAAWILIRQRR